MCMVVERMRNEIRWNGKIDFDGIILEGLSFLELNALETIGFSIE